MVNSLANKNGNNQPLDWSNPFSSIWDFQIDGAVNASDIAISNADFNLPRLVVVDDVTQPPSGGAALYEDQDDFEVEVEMNFLQFTSGAFFGAAINITDPLADDVGISIQARPSGNLFQTRKRTTGGASANLDGVSSPIPTSITMSAVSGLRIIQASDPTHTLRVRFNRTNYRISAWWNDCPIQVIEENTNLLPFGPAGIVKSQQTITAGHVQYNYFKLGPKGSLQSLDKMYWGGLNKELTSGGLVPSNGRRTVTSPAAPVDAVQGAIACPILEGSMYWEIVADVEPNDGDIEVGINQIGKTLNASMGSSTLIGGFKLNSSSGVGQHAGFGGPVTDDAGLPTWVPGDIIQLRYNAATRVLEIQVNNTGGWVAHQNLAAASEFYAPVVTLQADAQVTANFNLSDLTYGVPATYNAMSKIFATP